MNRLRPKDCLAIRRFHRLDELAAAQAPSFEVRREQSGDKQVSFRRDPAHASRFNDAEAYRLEGRTRLDVMENRFESGRLACRRSIKRWNARACGVGERRETRRLTFAG